MGISFRHSAGFGKRMEYNLVGQMLMEGLDVYLPLVDDHGVDCVIKKEDGTFIEIQIKARSSEVSEGDAALFTDGGQPVFDVFHDLVQRSVVHIVADADLVGGAALGEGKAAQQHGGGQQDGDDLLHGVVLPFMGRGVR